ncbi:MAG: hypothetical protein O9337_05560 [Acidovorax sp.]|uniref:hypothetical protein n=1 Tax=Acidovorax sp. TaxID=1872122 RepID=UPI0022BF2BF0|nr:hypothetical protein [Acidovorax sp.]MCZ8218866.1 hypothetical protein [Acidovorax sp.]
MHAVVRDVKDETLDGYLKSIIKKNEAYLKKINPGVDINVLYDQLFKPFLDDEIDGDLLTNIELLMDDTLPDERFIINHPSLVLFAYCNQAMKAQEKGEIDVAWKFLIEASYWLGMVNATSVMPAIQEVVAKTARSENAKKAGDARAQKYEILKEEAFRLVREKKPKNGWKSRLQATLNVLDDVIAFSKEKERPMSEQQAQKTIYGWLGDLKDEEGLFNRRH